jgi:hypothetical protein
MGNDDLPFRLSSGSQHRHGEASPISTPTAQPMIGTERLRTGIDSAPADWSSTFDTVLQCNTNHDTTGLCVTFGGAVDWKSKQLKPTAQSTTKLRTKHMTDASNGMSGRMVVWEELRAWHDLASVFCLFSVCFFNGLVFDRRDNALEEC